MVKITVHNHKRTGTEDKSYINILPVFYKKNHLKNVYKQLLSPTVQHNSSENT